MMERREWMWMDGWNFVGMTDGWMEWGGILGK